MKTENTEGNKKLDVDLQGYRCETVLGGEKREKCRGAMPWARLVDLRNMSRTSS